MPPRVYVVDDDPLVTTSLGTALRLETDWEVTSENDAATALGYMEADPPDVVLSDLQMPNMDGIAFLKEVRARHPDSVLLLLTGYADKESAIAAINEVGIWQYVEKPWDTNDLLVKVRQGLERRDLARQLEVRNRELEARVEELERTRRQLFDSERLAAVGRVIAGIAHELGNQLGLMGYADLIVEKTTDPEIADYARAIQRAQRRLGAMIGEIKDFARGGGTYQLEVQDVRAAVEEAVALLRFDGEVRARVLKAEFEGRPIGRIHRNKLMQVVINLVRNAAQASPPGAEVRVVLDDDHGPRLRVIDHGAGMPAEVVARLGEPFFTTKEGGTGLGLGITRRIVAEHGGTLVVRSEPGQGTEIEVRLPPAEATPEKARFDAARSPSA